MNKTNYQERDAEQPRAFHALPDPEIYVGRFYISPDLVECLAEKLNCCEHAMNYGGSFFCTHPLRMEIAVRTNVG